MILAWLAAAAVIPGPLPIFAAIAALLVVQPSLNQSFLRAVERSTGVIAGVLLATALQAAFGSAGWVALTAAVVALLLAWALRSTPGTANQMAISALLVLALSTGTASYGIDRIVETVIGAVIGLVVNVALVPPVAVGPARSSVNALAEELAQTLERLARALELPTTAADRESLLIEARLLRPMIDKSRAAIATASESLTLNPRGKRLRNELRALEAIIDHLAPVATQTVGMTRAFRDHSDSSIVGEPAVGAIAEQLRRAAHDVRRAAHLVASGEPATDTALLPALTTPLTVLTPSADHWVLIGSLLEDLRRMHDELTIAPREFDDRAGDGPDMGRDAGPAAR